ncbi:MAG: hypothetical protein QXG39_03740 [Candidatus Aenigmatarchaeota archaeon]
MKGIGPVAIALLITVFGLSAEAIYMNLFIGTRVSRSIVSQEVEIIKAVNRMEMVKIGLPYALEYSFSQAIYDVFKNGGYTKLPDNIPKYNNLPIWREYDKIYPPNIEENIEKLTLIYLNQYTKSLEFLDASYNEVDISESEECLNIKAGGNQDLKISSNFFSLYETSNISISIKSNFFNLYKLAKERFLDNDSIGEAISRSLQSFDCSSNKDSIRATIEQTIKNTEFFDDKITLSLNCIDVVFKPTCNSTVALIVEVSIKDNFKYIVYDGTNDYRNPELKFFVKTSNDYSFTLV